MFNDGRKIEFIYDATGKKWRKTAINADGTNNNYRDYIGDAEYLNGNQDIIHFTEGYAQRDITTDGDGVWNGWVYKYTLKDHLGNTRVTYSDKNKDGIVTTGDIEQVNQYYSFGLNMEGPWNGVDGAFKYGYNSKEWNDDFGIGLNDYGARFYDAAVARWWSVDPESESGGQSSWNPYHYVMDNPVKNIDPDGREGEGCCGGALAADILSSSFGVAVGFTDNLFGTNLRDNVSLGSNQQAFQAGLNVADKGSLVGGATMVVGGGAVAAGGGTVSLTVVGASVGVPATLAGSVVAGAGVWINQNAVKHLQESQAKANSTDGTTTTANNTTPTNTTIPTPPKGKGSVEPSQRDPQRAFTEKQKSTMLDKQGGNCVVCNEKKTVKEVAGHHIERHADGGKTTLNNGAAVCTTCHKKIHK